MTKRASLLTAILLLSLSAAMAWKYPDDVTLGELAFRTAGFSPWSKGTSGFYFPGIIFTLLFLSGLVLLYKTMRQHRFLVTISLLILIPMLPQTVAAGYQSVFAEGIYALELRNNSSCHYKVQQGAIEGACTFTFKNYGQTEVSFNVSLRDSSSSPSSLVGDLDVIGHQRLTIAPREQKTFSIPFQLKLPDGYDVVSSSGSINGLNITVRDGEHFRSLKN
ncbi:hypothetical protein [Paenibacillus sp. MBLB4367]|uniref:hypothetical protein n=1 Tax=Paenibacillus sp. MBLB4367 TaxID=3384767 RepID=UPI003907EC4A